MNFAQYPPLTQPIVDETGKLGKSWFNWFGNIFQIPAKTKPWSPVLSGLSPDQYTCTGTWTRWNRLYYFTGTITPKVSITSSGSTIQNLPFTPEVGSLSLYTNSSRALIGDKLILNSAVLPGFSGADVMTFTGIAQIGSEE